MNSTWNTEPKDDGFDVTILDVCVPIRLSVLLCSALPDLFPTASASKRACRGWYSCNYVVQVMQKTCSGELDASEATSKQAVLVNCETCVRCGDVVRIRRKQVAPMAVIFEDDAMCVVHKPAGVVMHGPGERTFKARVAAQLPGAVPVHRLDELTEGLVICGRDPPSVRCLHDQFERRTIQKRYIAVVYGHPATDGGECNEPVEGREALSTWRIRWCALSATCGLVSCLEVVPHTGRQHQIRQHLAQLGHPIIGDPLFPYPGITRQQKQRQPDLLLAAVGVAFFHPVSGASMSLSLLSDKPIRSEHKSHQLILRFDAAQESETIESRFFHKLAILPDDSSEVLLAEALRAGQKQNRACAERWTADCIARDGAQKKDPRNMSISVLQAFFAAIHDEFASEPWLQCAQHHLEMCAKQMEKITFV